jgi:hypothetical protein
VLKIRKPLFCSAVLTTILLSVSVLQAQQPSAAAPIPAQVIAARKVFISNAGQDGLGGFSGDPDRTYNQFYAAMKSWGQYDLVSSPSDADLVFEISFDVQATGPAVIKGDSIGTGYAPRFRLLIRDPKTHFILWSVTKHINWARLESNRDKDFDQGMADLVVGLKKLTPQSTTTADAGKR